MSKFTDELREISAWHSSYDEDALSDTVGLAADLLDEAEKALVEMLSLVEFAEAKFKAETSCGEIARATLARIRGEQP